MEESECRQTNGVALMASNAMPIVKEILKSNGQLRRKQLIAEVDRIHKERGGIAGQQTTESVVKKVLTRLSQDGGVERVAFATWRGAQYQCGNETRPGEAIKIEIEDDDLVPEATTGEGLETVYVYFNPNDRKLAALENRTTWECKIGRTSSDLSNRIYAQGVKTAFAHRPVVGLAIKTDDAEALERIMHAMLCFVDADQLDGPGTEWYITSPEIVALCYSKFMDCLDAVKNKIRLG